jgi:hypothetical protein
VPPAASAQCARPPPPRAPFSVNRPAGFLCWRVGSDPGGAPPVRIFRRACSSQAFCILQPAESDSPSIGHRLLAPAFFRFSEQASAGMRRS